MGETLPPFTVGIVLYPGFDLLDVAGPNEVFTFFDAGVIGRTSQVISVAKDLTPLPIGGVTVTPRYTFDDPNRPAIDLLFVPGGGPLIADVIGDDVFLRALRDIAATARYVTSVCTGGILLASAGLLDGYQATTHWAVVDSLKLFPDVKVVNGCPRWVHDGNRITGGGISSTVDESIYMVETIVADFTGDLDTAQNTAHGIQLSIQYSPDPPFPGGDPCSVPYEIYAPVYEGMAGFRKAVHDAVVARLGG
jgi:cyclohexyl-isocyanide hydratase